MRGHRLAVVLSMLVTSILMVLIYLGSRGLKDFDSALIGYAVGTLVAVAALVYRYTLWVQRPSTWRYFKGGWGTLLAGRTRWRVLAMLPKALFTDILAQTYILPRGKLRWFAHLCLFWGVMLSLAITIPLTFGWLRFTQVPPERMYQVWVFGLPLVQFPPEALVGFVLFHALNFTSILVIIGVVLFLWRRNTDAGLLTTQLFSFDMLPLFMLLAISLTGLALTASSMLWEGHYYWFISLAHQVIVVVWLLSLPFGKFFHIVQRPATIGVKLYQNVSHDIDHYQQGMGGRTACARCGDALPSAQFVADLKATLRDLGQDYTLGEAHGSLHDYCPACKRALRGQAYYQYVGRRFL
ncbi:MFS transporter [Chloroflexia bacterium SDU3-3]|nr:MFS transporter [Chloroflexia bacterium SDU3-3]